MKNVENNKVIHKAFLKNKIIKTKNKINKQKTKNWNQQESSASLLQM